MREPPRSIRQLFYGQVMNLSTNQNTFIVSYLLLYMFCPPVDALEKIEPKVQISEFFQRARQVTPAILFFDELDSLAPIRGGSLGEPQITERVVNQLLAEMDGIEDLKGVVVMGATNRPDMVDPAHLRPGRLDEMVHVPVPNRDARAEIFRKRCPWSGTWTWINSRRSRIGIRARISPGSA